MVRGGEQSLKIRVVVHEAEEGGYWPEVPAIPGCVAQGDTPEGLTKNVHEAVEGYLSIDVEQPEQTDKDRVLEIIV
jgi:predicted RNase H-like HicB family nuclease